MNNLRKLTKSEKSIFGLSVLISLVLMIVDQRLFIMVSILAAPLGFVWMVVLDRSGRFDRPWDGF